MRRELLAVAAIMLISGAMATTANLGWHRLDWIATPSPQPPVVNGHPASTKPAGPTVDQILAHLENGTAHFVDAREPHEYADGHLRGATFLPQSAVYEKVEDMLSMVPIEEKIIVYCGGPDCHAAEDVAAVLREYNYADVEVYISGWEEIETSGRFDECIVMEEDP